MPDQVRIYPHLSQANLFPIGLVDVTLLCINSNLNVMIRQELVQCQNSFTRYDQVEEMQTYYYRRCKDSGYKNIF
jgi:hypothetical protein